jgi:hypothetical protein
MIILNKMFKTLENTSYFSVIKEDAAKAILDDRKKFSDLYNIIDTYCKNHSELIISDAKMLLDKVDNLAFKTYDIYCENPFMHATVLTNEIYTKVGKWVQMTTIIIHQELQIWYDTRLIATIYKLIKGKEIDLENLINPIKIYGINYMSPEIEIIDIYKRLYLPNYASEWLNLLEVESFMEDLVKQRSEILGGDSICGNIARRQKTDMEDLKLLLYNNFIISQPPHDNNRILIGHWAINTAKAIHYSSLVESHVEKLQIISSNAENDIKEVKKIIEKHTDLAITHKQHILHLPKDFRIKRYTLYLSSYSQKEIPFMDIFNSAEFELIPFNTLKLNAEHSKIPGDINIGNPYVLLRFAIIDIWILRVISKIGNITQKCLLAKLRSLYELINIVKHDKIKELQMAFGTHYIGTNIDYESAKKIEKLQYKMIPPYIPILAQKQGKYRIKF